MLQLAGATPATLQTCSQQRASHGRAGDGAAAEEAARPGGARGTARRRERLPSVLLRLVDDFLFITPSRAAAEAVATRLLQGAPISRGALTTFACLCVFLRFRMTNPQLMLLLSCCVRDWPVSC